MNAQISPKEKIQRKKDEMVFLYLLDKVEKDWKSVGIVQTEFQGNWLKRKLAELVMELCNKNRIEDKNHSNKLANSIIEEE